MESYGLTGGGTLNTSRHYQAEQIAKQTYAAMQQAAQSNQYDTQKIAATEATPIQLLLNESHQLAEVCAQFANRLGTIEDKLLGGIPRAAENKTQEQGRRCSGILGEIEGAHHNCVQHLHRLKATIERLEQNI